MSVDVRDPGVYAVSLALLFLEAIFFANPRLEKQSLGLIFRFDNHPWLLLPTFQL
jgi:hypothetical protein